MLLWRTQRHQRHDSELCSLKAWQLVDKLHIQGKQHGHNEGINPRDWGSGSGLRLWRIPRRVRRTYCCFIVLFAVWKWVISPQEFMMVDYFHHDMLTSVSLMKYQPLYFVLVHKKAIVSLPLHMMCWIWTHFFPLLQSPQKIISGKWICINLGNDHLFQGEPLCAG